MTSVFTAFQASANLQGQPRQGEGGFTPLVVQTSYQQVSDALREDIIAGIFKGDERLIVSTLQRRYGVSAPPIREALSQLQVEGLVVIEANRGARVRDITPAFVSEIFEIRIVLEPALVERSIPLFRSEHIAELESIEDKFEVAIAGRIQPDILKYNWMFHTLIYHVRPNNEAMRLLNQHSALIATLRNQYGYDSDRLDIITKEHRALIKACANHDAPAAISIARRHIERSVADLLSRIDLAKSAAPATPGPRGQR